MLTMQSVGRWCMSGLLALAGWSGAAAALTLDEAVLSASGTGGLVTGAAQAVFSSSSLVQPINLTGGFRELGVLHLTSFLDAQGQPLASGVGSAYGLYVTFNLLGNAVPIPGTSNEIINFTSGDVKLWADRKNDSAVNAVVENPQTGALKLDRGNVADDVVLADNTGVNAKGATLLEPSPLGIPGLYDGSSNLSFSSWILGSLGNLAFGGTEFPYEVLLDSRTLGPLLPVSGPQEPLVLRTVEAGVLTFVVPEPASFALALGGFGLLAVQRRRRR